jgi:uncharacterized damage-inducible protein DinB
MVFVMGEPVQRLLREWRHDEWANRALLRHLLRESSPPAGAVERLGHVLAAQDLWLARLLGTKSEFAVWPKLTLDELEGLQNRLHERWAAFLEALDEHGLQRTVAYTNTKGEAWTSRVEDVLTHVWLHGSHHRGQITSELRAADLTPPLIDFIHAARTGALDPVSLQAPG